MFKIVCMICLHCYSVLLISGEYSRLSFGLLFANIAVVEIVYKHIVS